MPAIGDSGVLFGSAMIALLPEFPKVKLIK
jgi:hypothetical protein